MSSRKISGVLLAEPLLHKVQQKHSRESEISKVKKEKKENQKRECNNTSAILCPLILLWYSWKCYVLINYSDNIYAIENVFRVCIA